MVLLSAGQSEAVGGPVVPVGEDGVVEFPLGIIIGDVEGDDEVVVALPEAVGRPVEGPTPELVGPDGVVVKTEDGVADDLPVPTGAELLPLGVMVLEVLDSPTRVPVEKVGLPIGPVEEDVADVVTEKPLEGPEGGTPVVPLPDAVGAVEEAGGADGPLDVEGKPVVPLPDAVGAVEEAGGADGPLDVEGKPVVPLPDAVGAVEEAGGAEGTLDVEGNPVVLLPDGGGAVVEAVGTDDRPEDGGAPVVLFPAGTEVVGAEGDDKVTIVVGVTGEAEEDADVDAGGTPEVPLPVADEVGRTGLRLIVDSVRGGMLPVPEVVAFGFGGTDVGLIV